ncbi:hypothetical protein HDU76_012567 [Blyttiomyces sp. JEL0837]|nr:hypothetical protein HDU76_012567 [Blyttiomyces sp. JEL0837]
MAIGETLPKFATFQHTFEYHFVRVKMQRNGRNLAIVKYLHDAKGVAYQIDMTITIEKKHGSVQMMKYVVDNMLEAVFTTEVMDVAAGLGNINVVRFLFENLKEGCTTLAVEMALEGEFLENGLAIAGFLVETYPGYFDLERVVTTFNDNVVVTRFLVEGLIAFTC